MRRPLLAALLLVVVAGLATLVLVGQVLPPAGRSSTGSLAYGGLERSYRLFVPDSAAGRPAPLLLLLHGYHDSAASFEKETGFDREAAARGLVVAYPDGYAHSWNAGSICCGEARARGLDDEGFLFALLDRLEAELPVDRSRVYVAGMSNGGMMSLRLACEAPARFAAAASVAGELEVRDCAASPPISVLQVHGTADRIVPAPGFVVGPPGSDPVTVFQHWLAADRCAAVAPAVTSGGLRTRTGTGCAAGSNVTQVDVFGADHVWPKTGSALVAAFLLAHHR